MVLPRIDHHGYTLHSRDDLKENVVYTSTGVKRAIWYLREGDRIRIQREGKSYPQIELEVVGKSKGVPTVQSENTEYELFAEEDPIDYETDCEEHNWRKTSMVTEDGGFDWVECEECGIAAKRHGVGNGNIEIVGER